MAPGDPARTVTSTTDGTIDGAPAPPGPPPFTPVRYGRYQLVGRVGMGGMAEVFLAIMTGPEGFKRELVVKRILPRMTGNPEFVRMFINEAKISALLSHPNIVQIYEFGEAEGTYFISMESVYGVTLRTALTKLREAQRPMPFMVAADIARQVCLGLDYAHTLASKSGTPLEIIHQDVSPTNIMLAHNGTVKILDFGIARAAAFAEAEEKRGLIKGKVAFLSPEQIHLRPLDHRVDIFSLGVVLHEMLTGARLFQPKNDIIKMRELLEGPIAPPSSVNATVPRELDRIVMKALQKDRDRRYPSAAAMANDLERTLIAARYSSRELSKTLHELFFPAEEPLVIVEAEAVPNPATAALLDGGPLPGSTVVVSDSTPAAVAFHGAADAEKARLLRVRWRSRVMLLVGAVACLGVVLLGIEAWKKYGPLLLPMPAEPAAKVAEPTAPAPKTATLAPATTEPARARPGTNRRQRNKAARATRTTPAQE